MASRAQTYRALIAGVLVLAWFGILADRSHALYTDSASLTGNSIITGSVDLLVSNSQAGSSTTYAAARPGFELHLSPSQTDEHFLLLKNSGSGNVSLGLYAQVAASASSQPVLSATSVELTPVDADGNAVGTPVTATLGSMLATPLDMRTSIASGDAQRFRMRTKLDSTFSGQAVTAQYDLIFNGVQTI